VEDTLDCIFWLISDPEERPESVARGDLTLNWIWVEDTLDVYPDLSTTQELSIVKSLRLRDKTTCLYVPMVKKDYDYSSIVTLTDHSKSDIS
jgi:hypothetical protein